MFQTVPGFPNFLQLIHDNCDLMLDSYTQNMLSKTLDTLYVGTPILTVIGDYPDQRFTASILKLFGLDNELVARDWEDFVAKAVSLVQQQINDMNGGEEGPLDRLRNSILSSRSGNVNRHILFAVQH